MTSADAMQWAGIGTTIMNGVASVVLACFTWQLVKANRTMAKSAEIQARTTSEHSRVAAIQIQSSLKKDRAKAYNSILMLYEKLNKALEGSANYSTIESLYEYAVKYDNITRDALLEFMAAVLPAIETSHERDKYKKIKKSARCVGNWLRGREVEYDITIPLRSNTVPTTFNGTFEQFNKGLLDAMTDVIQLADLFQKKMFDDATDNVPFHFYEEIYYN